MRVALKLLILSTCLYSSAVPCFANNEASTLEGQWDVVAMRHNGRPDGGASFRGMKWAFSKAEFSVWAGTMTPAGRKGKPPMKGIFMVDDSKDPRQLTLTFPGKEKPYDITAIYRFQADQLLICIGKSERPKTFDTAGTKNLCYVLQAAEFSADKGLEDDEPSEANESSN